MGDTMKIKVAFAGLVLCLTLFATTFNASVQPSSTRKLAGVINDFSPRSTIPTGPYVVNGSWSLQLHPNGKAEFTASLTMVRSDLWFIETGGDPESQADRNFHTHHVLMTDGEVSAVGSAIVVNGTAVITSNGNQVFPGSTVQIEISGGPAVAPSNIKLTFGAPASNHFTSQPYEGVVVVR
jgi:hypothetical protein